MKTSLIPGAYGSSFQKESRFKARRMRKEVNSLVDISLHQPNGNLFSLRLLVLSEKRHPLSGRISMKLNVTSFVRMICIVEAT